MLWANKLPLSLFDLPHGTDLTAVVTFHVTGMMLANLGWNWHGAQAPFAFALRAILVSIGPRAGEIPIQ